MDWSGRDGHSYAYPGTLIHVAAIYAFYRLTLATVNIFKYRKFNSPVWRELLDSALRCRSNPVRPAEKCSLEQK